MRPRGHTVEQQRQCDVVDQPQVGHELAELQDDSHLSPSQATASGLVQLCEVVPELPHRSDLGTQDPAGQVQQGDLPQQLGPVTATVSPAATSNEIPHRALMRR